MQLRSIEVRDFRKLSRVSVRDLKDGLNVVVGDNEAGKSTLLAALRTVLFERYRVGGEVAERMLPYGQSVRPEITIEFDLNGKPWRLHKAFCQRHEAELASNGERYTGDEVDERLADLLGFVAPGRGGSQPDKHQGIYGLLWVEQGASHRALNVGAGKGTLASALEAEVGQVLGGARGRALLDSAEQRRSAFWDKRGSAKGDYRGLRDEVAKLVEQKAALEAQLATYDGKVVELEARQEALARHNREDRLERAVQDLEKARQAVEQVRAFENALRDAAERAKRCAAEQHMAAERRRARDALVRKLNEARTALAEAEMLAGEGGASFERHAALARTAEQRLTDSRARLKALADAVAKVERELARRKAADELVKIAEQLAEASAADEKRREALALAASVTLTEQDVAALEELRRELDKARAQLDAASVRITFEPDGARAITVDGAAHDAARPLALSNDARLHLEGFGTLLVRPGGGVDALARRVEAARQALDARLQAVGFATIADAAAAVQRKRRAEQEAAAHKRLMNALAPKGLDALRDQVEGQKIAAAPSGEPRVEASDAVLTQLRRDMRTLEDEVETNDTAAEQARKIREREGREQAARDERLAGARRDHEARSRELADARAQVADEDLAVATQQAEARFGEAEAAEAAARRALEAAEPEVAALTLKRAEAAERSIREDIAQLTRQKRDLEIELRALGQEGLGEQLAETEGRLAFKQRKLAAMDVEALAARLLHDTLVDAQRESKDRWLGPVRERVRPYLKLIQPDSDIVLNEETMEIESFVRNGRIEPFTGLSVGAREQVAVITRLALAEMLVGAGQPSAVILDDALVNSDEGRLERMHLVLQKASDALQILVLTCRERDFVQLGAPIRRVS